jgi:rhodanese-related sulfurtransferase
MNELSSHLSKLNKDTIIITCCASGMKMLLQKIFLKSNGFTNVYNGGGCFTE